MILCFLFSSNVSPLLHNKSRLVILSCDETIKQAVPSTEQKWSQNRDRLEPDAMVW